MSFHKMRQNPEAAYEKIKNYVAISEFYTRYREMQLQLMNGLQKKMRS